MLIRLALFTLTMIFELLKGIIVRKYGSDGPVKWKFCF